MYGWSGFLPPPPEFTLEANYPMEVEIFLEQILGTNRSSEVWDPLQLPNPKPHPMAAAVLS